MHKKQATFIAVILLAILIGAIAYHKMTPTPPEAFTEEVLVEGSATTEPTSTTTETVEIDIEKAKTERILGNPDAPIKITEHASFSCGHCAHFHETTFTDLKKNWIDTGRAYLVFSDFPLNAPALHATLASRCIADDEQYFAFVKTLFAQQNDWAFTSSYIEKLKTIAGEYGLDAQTFEACTQNEELQQAVVNRMRATQQQFEVNSTPSFVVNNSVTIAGALPYEKFNEKLEEAITAEQATPDKPETSPEPEAEVETTESSEEETDQ